jgi:hypothetical protein
MWTSDCGPAKVDIVGPASALKALTSAVTEAVSVEGARATVIESVTVVRPIRRFAFAARRRRVSPSQSSRRINFLQGTMLNAHNAQRSLRLRVR